MQEVEIGLQRFMMNHSGIKAIDNFILGWIFQVNKEQNDIFELESRLNPFFDKSSMGTTNMAVASKYTSDIRDELNHKDFYAGIYSCKEALSKIIYTYTTVSSHFGSSNVFKQFSIEHLRCCQKHNEKAELVLVKGYFMYVIESEWDSLFYTKKISFAA